MNTRNDESRGFPCFLERSAIVWGLETSRFSLSFLMPLHDAESTESELEERMAGSRLRAVVREDVSTRLPNRNRFRLVRHDGVRLGARGHMARGFWSTSRFSFLASRVAQRGIVL